MRRALTTVAFLAIIAAPLRADLEYTMHVTMTKADPPAAQADPLLLARAAGQMKSPLPDGPADVVYVIGDRGARAEYRQGAHSFPAGTVTITKPNGDMFVLDPKNKTYWKVVAPVETAQDKQNRSELTSEGLMPHSETSTKRTGEFSEIAGVRCERVLFDLKLTMPMTGIKELLADLPPELQANLPPGFGQPITMQQSIELWVAVDRYKEYAIGAAKRMAASLKQSGEFITMLGMDKMPSKEFVMREIDQSPDLGYSLESVVTAIREREAPASLFEIPSGYKEVPAPKVGPGLP